MQRLLSFLSFLAALSQLSLLLLLSSRLKKQPSQSNQSATPTPSPQPQQMAQELPFDDNELDNGVFDPELIKDGYDPDHVYLLDWLDLIVDPAIVHHTIRHLDNCLSRSTQGTHPTGA